jgi:nucleotide-binding universal stress UspA family protein
MKKVLIALDYDPTAQKVAETGYDLAKAMNAKVILLHVISDATQYSYLEYSPIMGFGGFNTLNIEQKDPADALKNLAQKYLDTSRKHLGDGTIQTEVRSGNFGETILKTATEVKADMIVMGTHSRRGLEKILVGSVAENVLHHSAIPMLIIPTKATDK